AGGGDRIAQIVGNLVGNAVQYGRARTPVRITTRVTPDTVVLGVHNEGPPIPAQRLPVLFEPFQRAAEPDKATRSVGLGLYIVNHLVEAHGGQMAVHSTP